MTPLDILLAFVSLALPFGIFAFGLGFLLFIAQPLVPRITRRYHAMARMHLWLGAQMLKRVAVVVSEHGDLLLKRMTPDDVGTEKISFGDTVKEFEDPHQAKSHWMGIPFALADEVHGVLFDPTDAAIGRREQQLRDDGELQAIATEHESDTYDVLAWQNAVYEIATDAYELVDLNKVRHLMTGSERSEHPQRVEIFYRNSRRPYQSKRGAIKLFVLLAAIIAPFGAVAIIKTQLMTGGGDGGSSVSYGLIGLLPVLKRKLPTREEVRRAARIVAHVLKELLIAVLVFGWLPAGLAALWVLAGPVVAVVIAVWLLLGWAIGPLLILLFRVSRFLSNGFGPRLLKLGFAGYDDPVFVLTGYGYKMRAAGQLETTEHVTYHTLLGRRVGFSFEPEAGSFYAHADESGRVVGSEVVDADRLDAQAVADGGHETPTSTNIPPGYQRLPERKRAEGLLAGMVPKRLDSNALYVWSDVFLKRFRHAATGEKSHKRLLAAKEQYGEGGALSESGMVYAVSALSLVSLLSGVAVFFFLT